MSKIVANIPAKKTISRSGKVFETKEYSETFYQDSDGKWTHEFLGKMEGILQEDVIDLCKKAKNWKEIRRSNFPMVGFHN